MAAPLIGVQLRDILVLSHMAACAKVGGGGGLWHRPNLRRTTTIRETTKSQEKHYFAEDDGSLVVYRRLIHTTPFIIKGGEGAAISAIEPDLRAGKADRNWIK